MTRANIQSARRMTFFIILFASLTAHAFAGGGPEAKPAAVLSHDHYDFGDIIPQRGTVSTDFSLANKGDADLRILDVATSCSCTTAVAERSVLAPGESTRIHVTFDPLAHAGVSGPIVRTIYVKTDDPKAPELTFTVTGVVVGGGASQPWTKALSPQSRAAEAAEPEKTAVIYFNKACGMCADYLEGGLGTYLESEGYALEWRDYVDDPKNRERMNSVYESIGVPPALVGHVLTVIDDGLYLGGHVPLDIVREALGQSTRGAGLYIVQDKMSGAEDYTVLDFGGNTVVAPLGTSLHKALAGDGDANRNHWEDRVPFIYLVLGTGFLDGVNPCAFSVLIFFILFLLGLKKNRATILLYGGVFVLAVFTAYLLIGFGILRTLLIFENSHLVARITIGLLILVGAVNIKDFFFYGRGPSLSPHINLSVYSKWLTKVSIPAVFAVGLLVGLCTFPCTGGIYVSILGMIASGDFPLASTSYLLLYNLMFVLPLVIILLAGGSKRTLAAITRAENAKKRELKLVLGLVMWIVAIIMWIWI